MKLLLYSISIHIKTTMDSTDQFSISVEGHNPVQTLTFKTTYGTLNISVYEKQPYLVVVLNKNDPKYKRSEPFTQDEVLQDYGYIIDQIPEFVSRKEALTHVTMAMNDFAGFF